MNERIRGISSHIPNILAEILFQEGRPAIKKTLSGCNIDFLHGEVLSIPKDLGDELLCLALEALNGK